VEITKLFIIRGAFLYRRKLKVPYEQKFAASKEYLEGKKSQRQKAREQKANHKSLNTLLPLKFH